MSEISRSVRIVKQAKRNVLTVQSVQMLTWQRPYDDVACLYVEVAVDDVAIVDWQMWTNPCDTWHHFGKWYGATWPRHGLPCGTLLLVWVFGKILWSLWGSNPGPPPPWKILGGPPNQCAIHMFLNIYCF
jgi:hypothetical protein